MLSTIVGVVLGFSLALGWERIRSIRDTRNVNRTVRRLLDLEIKSNLEHIKKHWSIVSESENHWFSKEGEFLWGTLARTIGKSPLSALSHECWHANLSRLVDVYKGSELTGIWRHYEGFSELVLLHRHLAHLVTVSDETQRHYSMRGPESVVGGYLISGMSFGQDAIPIAERFYALVETLLGEEADIFQEKTPNDAMESDA